MKTFAAAGLLFLMGAAVLVSRRFAAIEGEPARETPQTQSLPSAKEIAMLPADGGPEFNRLIHEKSPYLLQHARNPVDWYPWGEEAFERARKEDKPVFLSLGYSTCHWCHVMERESFENPAIAALLNASFIAIKVDREERPDLDEIYMNATQLMTGSGGWPNSVWLLPDKRPWHAGTYFPPEDGHGRPGFASLLKQLTEIWRTRRDDVEKQARELSASMKRLAAGTGGGGTGDLSRGLVSEAVRALRSAYDQRLGGFGGAPKFPPHGALRLLLYEYRRTKDKALLDMATLTLDRMAVGGIHDHLGGGFHRYSTDARWFLPHFEKMLYDNAQLSKAYVEAFLLTGDRTYRRVAEAAYEWVLRDMTGKEGAFYSALDADSEGEEGKFYVWTRGEVLQVLGEETGRLFCDVYNLEPGGNFHDEAAGVKTGASIAYLAKPLEELAKERGVPAAELRQQLDAAGNKLLSVRNARVWPHLDDKVLTAWNGLMIGSLAYGGQHLNRPRYVAAARKAADFVLATMWSNGRLLRSYRGGEARLDAYLEDYAFLADGLLDLYDATRERRYLDEARRLMETVSERYGDEERGGFFFTASDHEKLLLRSKDAYDQAMPSGNGMATRVLLRLAEDAGDTRLHDLARRSLDGFVTLMERAPRGTESLILSTAMFFDSAAGPARQSGSAHEDKPDARTRQRPVTAELFTARVTAAPGETFAVAVRLRVDEGWHVNSSKPLDKELVATSVAIPGEAAFGLNQVEYPEGSRRALGFSKESLSVYEGEVWVRGTVTVAKETAIGDVVLSVEVRCQACNDRSCGAPQSLKLSVPFHVRREAPVGWQHQGLFKRPTAR
ncbi:MAG: hypothetical protein AUJ96_06345 [Armatimonadetes bacterium CG2_30_66_41]|nr:DUF255 domain-containing protein [Armatimonadota bacterium]OIP08084.1 MAG: hypothetical protein AUJ96_06345 [Armatimonadetes bacterium CG2_30_66_41]NCO89956.1 DUF255 domain-containing protein [Armatimonadota bacterium]NCP29816.1 DUF255 domain-containing protein [Armatimonadota bacterium]NCQ30013.1 DUF255 domain-containing protein [Armatimonadota bacterium]